MPLIGLTTIREVEDEGFKTLQEFCSHLPVENITMPTLLQVKLHVSKTQLPPQNQQHPCLHLSQPCQKKYPQPLNGHCIFLL